MFEIGWSELLVIAVVAVVVIGPKDLPRALRSVGQWTAKMKRMAREFQGQFNEALREAELDTIKRDVEELAKQPFADVNKELDKTGADIRQGLADAAKAPEAQVPLMSPLDAPPAAPPPAEPVSQPAAEPVRSEPLPAPEEAKS